MNAAPTPRPWVPPHPAGGGLLLGALFLVGFNLRTTMASLPPLLTGIQTDLGVGGLGAGLLTGLPVACMGLLAPGAHRLARRVGPRAAVAIALALLTAGLGLRLAGQAWPVLYGATLLAGGGIAVAGTLLPAIVKQQFPDRPGAATAVYATAMTLGSVLAAGASVPLAGLLGSWQRSLAAWALPAGQRGGGWQRSLAAWALPAAAALTGWIVLHASRGGADRLSPARASLHSTPTPDPAPTGPPVGLPWRSRTAWLVSGYLTVQAALFYSSLAWLAPAYIAHGWQPRDAGLLLALFATAQLLATLIAPAVADHVRDRRPLLLAASAVAAVGLAALAAAPELAPAAWVALLGLGLGAGFALGLVLLVDHASNPSESARLSAMAFLISYTLAAAAPSLTGAMRDVTGDFQATFTALALLALAQLVLITRLTPARRL